jgi:hypothetical protein
VWVSVTIVGAGRHNGVLWRHPAQEYF